MSITPFNASLIPDLSGKIALVTGGNTGIGYITCLELVRHNAKVYLGARNKDRAQEAIKQLKNQVPTAQVEWLSLDLGDLNRVEEAASNFKKKESRLHLLINNAGIMATPYETNKDGIEIQFATNYIGHFFLTHLLLPTLSLTAKDSAAHQVRVVNISSLAHNMAPNGGINFDDPNNTGRFFLKPWARYAQSKLANILHANYLDRHYSNRGIDFISLHPGSITCIFKVIYWFAFFVFITPDQGALTTLFAATSPKAESGKYYIPFGKEGTISSCAGDDKLQDRLYEWTCTKLKSLGYIQD
ncbi:putative oxidoreductase [Neolecta irregularis DAH-3]|uniref:Putative oxidoreductase n=1 Tax=Neolecta irregularis (strain DAH-3) TaxID=1198029 RepID=A0A1U7LNT2_NEOID|nr:putative oxidoreductase [Neolecta irregularis DAH-3]|eukprot:OLL24330.1 putative oxidoreductase [Neolecta irregularis DAH-3]